MNFLARLDKLMEERGLNKHTLSQKSEVPYSTINSFYTKGYENAKLVTLTKIARTLGVTLGYLAWGENCESTSGISESEYSLILKYRSLDERGQDAVENTLDYEYQAYKEALKKAE
ncbi:MAG: helix-turn-helix transcriptional regulator [Oscillospiraceae bacterium]|nr:helix-turn-helix transcriptional regulator [Oscillospiraceae bacterium]MCL2279879.1 helix-turn-helix transcriptional regulator [Oscillospiraceae bacterium]